MVIVIVIYNSFREANEVAFLLSTRGDRDASTGWGLRLTPQFRTLSPSAHTLLNTSKPSQQPKRQLGSYHQLLLSSWLYNHTACAKQPSHTTLPLCIPCFNRASTDSSWWHEGNEEGRGGIKSQSKKEARLYVAVYKATQTQWPLPNICFSRTVPEMHKLILYQTTGKSFAVQTQPTGPFQEIFIFQN